LIAIPAGIILGKPGEDKKQRDGLCI